eukprot:5376663-Amphidinium_carterae.2
MTVPREGKKWSLHLILVFVVFNPFAADLCGAEDGVGIDRRPAVASHSGLARIEDGEGMDPNVVRTLYAHP